MMNATNSSGLAAESPARLGFGLSIA